MLPCPIAGTLLSVRSILGDLSFSQRPLEGTHALLCFNLKGTWGSLEILTEAETSFLGFTLLISVLKQNLGLTCPYKQVYKHMDLSLHCLSEGHTTVFSLKVVESGTGAAVPPVRNLSLGFLPAVLFSLSVYTKDRPHSTVSVQPNHDTHWAVNTHANTKRERKRKSGSLSISLGMFICPS